ncbi:MAG: hypothetical protein PHI58_05555 [Candidatus Omnitrophica bacterium]|nr:hypothetical protein [Candidatus Omnitrophota bacterium]
MNIRNLAIIAAVVALLVSLVASVFIGTLFKENAPPPVSPAESMLPAAAEEAPAAEYAIPENTIPSAVQMEAIIKKNREERKQIDEAIAKWKEENDRARQAIRVQAEAADKEAAAVAKQPASEALPSNAMTVKFSSKQRAQEQEQQKAYLKSKGLVAF